MSEEFMKLKLRCPKESEIQLIKKLAENGDKSVDLGVPCTFPPNVSLRGIII